MMLYPKIVWLRVRCQTYADAFSCRPDWRGSTAQTILALHQHISHQHSPNNPSRSPDPRNALVASGEVLPHVVAFGASTGELWSTILVALPAPFPAPIVIVQHLSPHTRSRMAQILEKRTPLRVKQAEAGGLLTAGTAYATPPGRHLLVRANETLSLSDADKVHHCRPSADVLFLSLAESMEAKAIGVVLTGGDGDAGIQAIKAAGGVTLAQDEATSHESSMPRHAAQTGSVDFVLPLSDIAPTLLALVAAPASLVLKQAA